MFETFKGAEEKKLNHSGRSYVGETMQLEGDLRSAGSIDVAGLINGNIYVSDINVTDTGSVRGTIEAASIEVYGHVEGKISADVVIVGKSAVIKGDIFFKNGLFVLKLNRCLNLYEPPKRRSSIIVAVHILVKLCS